MKDLPRDWFSPQSPLKALWVTALEIRGIGGTPFINRRRINVIGGRILLGSGEVHFVDVSKVHPEPDVHGDLHIDEDDLGKVAVRGNYALVVFPVVEDPRDDDLEPERYWAKTEVAIGLGRGVLGRNFGWSRLFENCYDLRTGHTYVYSEFLPNSNWHGPPDVSNQARARVQAAGAALEGMNPDERGRVELSLRWYNQSLAGHGVDSFLRLWIAIETLAMERGKVRPLTQALAGAYAIPLEAAYQKFAVHRLQEVRHRVVHEGSQDAVALVIMLYLEALYLDVLEFKLGLPNARRALAALDGVARNVMDHVKSRYGID